MAAETSVDAHVPVTLALIKLGLFYGLDVFSKEVRIKQFFLMKKRIKEKKTLKGTTWQCVGIQRYL